MNKLPISVIMITQNESDRIHAAIKSVSEWVSEIIIVDSGSTDDTLIQAKKLGAKTFFNEWQGYGKQKRFAEEQASHEWLLNLDADERVTHDLQKEIQMLIQEPNHLADGYYIAIHDVIYLTNKLNPKTPYKPIRLYNKSKGRYSDSPVHDRVMMEPNAKVKILTGKIAHESIRNFTHRVDKLNAYSSAQVADLMAKGRTPSTTRIIMEFWISFMKRYFLKGYWRQGLVGYIYAMNYAYSRFLRQIKLYEAYKNNDKNH